MATQKKLVAVVTGWVEVEVEEEALVEEILKAAGVAPADNDEFWTDRTTGVGLNDTTTDQVLLVIRDIPDLDDEDEDEEDEDEDEDEEDPDKDKKPADAEEQVPDPAGGGNEPAAGEGGGGPGSGEPVPEGGEPAGAAAGI